MRKITLLGLLLLSVAACYKIPAGNVGIKVNLYGSEKGVSEQEVLGPGRYFVGPGYDLFTFPTFDQNETWTAAENSAISFQTREGMNVDADIGIAYFIKAESVPVVFQTYRKGVDELTAIVLRNAVQDAFANRASVLDVKSVYGEGKVSLIRQVLADVQALFEPVGIHIKSLSWRSEVRVPASVKTAIDATIEADQAAARSRNEVASAKAEADKAIEAARGAAESTRLAAEAEAKNIMTKATAQAAANRELASSLTPELIESQRIKAWDGHLPSYVGAGAPIPFMEMK